ncbi:MAG TPA: glycosyltransferase family 2 protein [Stellaceae bacterium]|nr:glycosyltransferase family 2 protein [Stellaceae bacterium]
MLTPHAAAAVAEPAALGAPAPSGPDPVSGGLELSVVVPTFNESGNIQLLLTRLDEALRGIAWEVIFVDDDSPDGTAAAIRALAQTDRRVRCLHRIGRRGLSTAVIEGMLASSAPYLAVIDADLQHDERLLPLMLAMIKAEELDIVVGSRHAAGGGVGDWDRRRVAISGLAARLARLVVAAELADPMSGFFLLSRPAFESAVKHLSGQGFKILLDLFASTPVAYRFKEIPYVFGQRHHGESKLDTLAVWEYLLLLVDKMLGGYIPIRFVSFAAVGASGVAVHFLVLYLGLKALAFPAAQAVATFLAMTSNFVLNNMLTYRDRRLTGARFATGLLSFYAVCSLGAVANVGIASAAFAHHYTWWLSGLAGAAVGVVWNYAVSSVLTWQRR